MRTRNFFNYIFYAKIKYMLKEFHPKPGQIDFTHIKRVPVVNCVLRYEGKFLIVQRSEEIRYYPEYWNGISGFLDDGRSIE